MKKIFKKFKLSSFIASTIISFAYPIIKVFSIENNKLTVFSDSCFIVGLLFTIFGIFNSLYLHGDFDITTFIARKSFLKQKNETYSEYKENLKEKREGSFNYPLFNGILLIIIAIITSLFC